MEGSSQEMLVLGTQGRNNSTGTWGEIRAVEQRSYGEKEKREESRSVMMMDYGAGKRREKWG